MKERVRWPRLARPLVLAGVIAIAASGTHCDYTDYPLKPTFCDNWCRVLFRSNCEQEPENCVRLCEQSATPAQCKEREATLLSCYEATPPSEFVCSGQGFQQIVRPEERVCQLERDSLIDCAYPEVKVCLDVCRAAESSQVDAGIDAGASPQNRCPSRDIPCDSLCWAAQRELEQFRRDGGLAAGLRDLAGAVMACATRRADACRNGEGDGGPMNWTRTLLECAEELGF
jgi:hypothetical protein